MSSENLESFVEEQAIMVMIMFIQNSRKLSYQHLLLQQERISEVIRFRYAHAEL